MQTSRMSPSSSSSATKVYARSPTTENELNPSGVGTFHSSNPFAQEEGGGGGRLPWSSCRTGYHGIGSSRRREVSRPSKGCGNGDDGLSFHKGGYSCPSSFSFKQEGCLRRFFSKAKTVDQNDQSQRAEEIPREPAECLYERILFGQLSSQIDGLAFFRFDPCDNPE